MSSTATPPKQNISKAYATATLNSKIVRILRLALPAFVVLAIVGLLIKAFFFQNLPKLPNLDTANVSIVGTKITMSMPVVKGFGKQSKPYELKAERAEQDIKAPDVIDLKVLDADIAMAEGGNAKITANLGSYNSKLQKLELTSNVLIKAEGKGYDAKMSQATIDFKNNTMVSNQPVSVKFEDGDVKAKTMSVVDNGNKVVFEGDVKMTLLPKAPKQNTQASPKVQ